MKETKKKIITQKSGELGHIAQHYVSSNLIRGYNQKLYLVGVLDDCTRLAWVEVVQDIKKLTVMFSSMKMLTLLNKRYNLRFAEIMSNNDAEFCSRNDKPSHPFERLLLELGIKHKYTTSSPPQKDKMENFWKILNEDVIEDTLLESLEEFKSELEEYLIYYNELRPHQDLDQKTPLKMNNVSEKALK